MARKKVIAYGMNEDEFDDIKAVIETPRYTESFVTGELTDDNIQALQAKGIIIEVTPEQREVQTPGTLSRALPGRTGQRSTGFWDKIKDAFAGSRKAPAPPATRPRGRTKGFAPTPKSIPPFDPHRAYTYIIELNGPLLEEWRKHLVETVGIELLEYIPQNAYTSRLTLSQLNEVSRLTFVVEVRAYEAGDARAIDYMRPRVATKGGGDTGGPELFDIRLHSEQDMDAVVQWLTGQGAEVVGRSGSKIRVKLSPDNQIADDIAYFQGVAEVQLYVEPKLSNNRARHIIGLDASNVSMAAVSMPAVMSQTGDGEIIAVADTGLDDTHPDFPHERIVARIARGRPPNDWSDPNGHGTHVAGSALGDGTASNGDICGTAPAAKLVFQSLLDLRGGLGGLPINLSELFEEAYLLGARIHNNSWGADTESLYTFNSIEVDEFVSERRDMLLVVAAGNEGVASDRMHSDKGYVDWLSMSSPATAKNALTVGACRSDRTLGGYSNRSYGSVWRHDFPDPPIGNDKVSGDPEAIAGFSSRGPTDDRRIKPELVAPGTDVLSARSSMAPDDHFWGLHENNAKYAYMGGTSMAAPLVSGCAALVREYYVKTVGVKPSAALLKATLINSTTRLNAASALADHDKLPNYHQGFGRICMTNAIPNAGKLGFDLAVIDSWNDDQQELSRTGQRLRYLFSLSRSEQLRICLAWTDAPGRSVQNSLGILMEHSRTREKWLGNADRPNKLTPIDRSNNVHVIRIDNPPTGNYVIQVFARNLIRPPQDFALVVFGPLGAQRLTRL